jgi:hypothetical protein
MKSAKDRVSPFAETKRSRTSPPIRAYSLEPGKSPFDWEYVMADAVAIEPVSARKFPANREINREFSALCSFTPCPSRKSYPRVAMMQS